MPSSKAQWKCARCGKPANKCKGHPTSEPLARQVNPKFPTPKRSDHDD